MKITKKYLFSTIGMVSLSFQCLSFDIIPDSILKFNSGKEVIQQNGASSQAALPRKAKVLVWNIYKGKEDSFLNKYIENSKNTDLVLLQEFTDNVSQKKLKNELKDSQTNYAATFKLFGKNSSGVATISKVKTQKNSYQMSDGIAGIIPPKVALFSSYKIKATNKRLLVVNIHAKNMATIKTYQKQINDIFKAILNHTGPVLFAGDFNTWSEDRYNYIKMKLKRSEMKMIHFQKDNRMKAPIVGSLLKYFNYPLDNVYYKGFEIKNAQSLSTNDGSDHGAMKFEIHFTDESLNSLKDLRPGGSANYYETINTIQKYLEIISKNYNLNNLNTPTKEDIIQYKRQNSRLLPLRNFSFVNDSEVHYALYNSILYLQDNNHNTGLNKCIWALEVNGRKVFIDFMLDLLKLRVVDETRFLGIISKHADDLIPCS